MMDSVKVEMGARLAGLSVDELTALLRKVSGPIVAELERRGCSVTFDIGAAPGEHLAAND